MNAISFRKVSLGLLAGLTLPLALLRSDAVPAPARDLERGRVLYARHCAVCHGEQGRADGLAAYLLHPAPRNFASGKFRLISTQNGVPTQEDLIGAIRRGMPGSAMPPWEWLAEDDLWNLALFVRHLSIEGQVIDMLAWAEEQEEDLSPEEAREIVDDKTIPGAPIPVVAQAPSDPVTLHEGRRIYLNKCVLCHGESGTGDAAVNQSGELRNEDGTPNSARDFTAGIFKGGATHADIVRRIVGGLPGSPMPATEFEDPTEVAALVSFVQSLVKPGAQERVVQRRRSVPVARVVGPTPDDPHDPLWERATGAWIALMPLWWRDDRIEGVVAHALHDGETIAVRLSWRDPSQDDDILGARSFSDAAAIEISVERDPPLFAMGTAEHPVDIAFWRAAWGSDALAARDVRDRWPGMVDDDFPTLVGDLADQSITARAVNNTAALGSRPSGAEALMAQGFGTVGPRVATASSWRARGVWKEGYWDVVYSRSMSAATAGEPALTPGLSAYLAFAVWDGAFGDRNGQKSVSVWHRLAVAP